LNFSKQNLRKSAVFSFFIVAFFCVDRLIKNAVLGGFSYEGSCISFVFVLNDGVAFSWFAFLGTYLKWLQIALLVGVFFYLHYEKLIFRYALPVALIFAGGIANVYDRFVHGGVVDFIYWHCGFDFAIFNFADVIINVGVALLLVSVYMDEKQKKRKKDNL
jgi:signal peptidase II